MQKITVKIGSRVLTKKDGRLNEKVVVELVKDLASLMKQGIEVTLISSGAVALGRSVSSLRDNFEIKTKAVKYDDSIIKEQILAAVGQPELMAFYIKEFKKYGITCAQLLVTRSVFADREAYLSTRTVTENLLKLGILPIFNENDTLSPEELDFSDNDQLACMIASMLVVDKLIVLTNVDGVYKELCEGTIRERIPVIENPGNFIEKIDDSASVGKGGMKSKLISADLITSLGIPMHIANGLAKNSVSEIIKGKDIGTCFPTDHKKEKAAKAWLATAAWPKGKIIVSTCLADILKKKQLAASILFMGIQEIKGNFSKRDVVEICDEAGKELGKGLVRYDTAELKKKIEAYRKKTSQERAKIKTAEMIAVHYNDFIYS